MLEFYSICIETNIKTSFTEIVRKQCINIKILFTLSTLFYTNKT